MLSESKILNNRSQSVPKLPSIDLTTSKLFQNSSSLKEAKDAFIQIIKSESTKQKQDNEKNLPSIRRSLIQMPKNQSKNDFVSFTSINKNQIGEILSNLSRMRSKSSSVQAFIKAEMISNKNQADLIVKQIQQRQIRQKQIMAKKIKEITPAKMKKQIKVKEKFQSKVKTIKMVSLSMNFAVYERNLQAFKPYVDYQAIVVPDSSTIYFIGGRKNTPIVQYNANSDQWKQFQLINQLKPFGNTQGSIINISKQPKRILFFGGLNYYQPNFSQICNSMRIFTIQNNTLEVIKFSQAKVPCRAFHSQCIYGKYLVVSGGVNSKHKFFNNFMNYNFQQKFWSQLTVNKMVEELSGGFAKHCTLPIFHRRKSYSIYDEEPILQIDPYIKQQGIYIYGGQDKNYQLISKMFIMKLGSPSVQIYQPQIKGAPPLARKNCTMIRSRSFIIIHGGKNEEMRPFVLNSMHFLNLQTMSWINIEGQKPPYRYSHGMSSDDKTIFILGGKNVQGLSKQVFNMKYKQHFEYI